MNDLEFKTMNLQTLIVTLMLSTSTSAQLVSTGSQEFGPDSITLDYNSRLVWLDVGRTANQTWNSITRSMHPGQQFEDWRRATRPEIESVIDLSLTNSTPLEAIRLLGETGVNSTDKTGIQGHFDNGWMLWSYEPGRNREVIKWFDQPCFDCENPWIGTWLVKPMITLRAGGRSASPLRPVVVPEPTWMMLCLPVFMLAARTH